MKGKTKGIVVVAVKRRHRSKWPIPSPVALEGPRAKFARPRLPEVSLHPLSPSNEYPRTIHQTDFHTFPSKISCGNLI